jgi:hypothetical protein
MWMLSGCASAPSLGPCPLEGLSVVKLRCRARQLGLKALARTGRRTDLLQALAVLEVAACN